MIWGQATYVANAISHKYGSCCKALLTSASNISHADDNGQACDRAEETQDRKTNQRYSGVMCPLALPHHGTAYDNGKAAGHQKKKADVS